jgi:multidrug efflux pump subunit AcrA (membrane-fusion protein)
MDERVNEILKEAFDATYQHTLHTYAHDQKQQEYLAQRIATLEAQNAALLAALKPFAEMGKIIRHQSRVDEPIYGYNGVELTWQHFVTARALLADLDAKGKAE